ncbi:uncharacterized protein Z520_04764 [Fonsecaea multimorphosa CBS 102226]|uniref:DNA endonuclease activator Ctp1 C-terminal domain-containing protein n=1 Tax=Fonsecaea multimorphosa CBS 102226 TaxID=1442371 RepID=A0A0D2KR49_9EURO|nr:uncharacterized protein Z520_04764 [Fonsecaea multimorphosa CBS 102226]KIX99188.1 hypothetical protein Z520_04764 [Fonsecaea multimorphosa CBS 102226]OAL25885.1 hypothetical protein AYO22_04512 [Fonsecaea multimorphosa]
MSTPTLSLTSTLILALTQSEALQRQLEGSNRTVDRLKRENERLKHEIEELRQAHHQKQQEGPELAAQLDQLFRKDAEKQAEIDSLKNQLRKERRRSQNPCLSSPIVSSDEQTTRNASRKRQRVNSIEKVEPLQEIEANVPSASRTVRTSKSRGLNERGAEAISSLTEDGIDHNRDDTQNPSEKRRQPNNSPRQRLQTLLTAPTPAAVVPPRPNSARKGPITDKASEKSEPLRSRPLLQLDLSHFKVNPKYTGGLDYAFQDVVRNKEARKCLPSCMRPECCGAKFRVLAETLPRDPNVSDDELLREFLGPGSTDKIRSLTPLARANLVHEARASALAKEYGRMHRANYALPSTPPGFWDVDIPSTQQQNENQEQARQRQREEIERRYQEAMNGGRWIFADE